MQPSLKKILAIGKAPLNGLAYPTEEAEGTEGEAQQHDLSHALVEFTEMLTMELPVRTWYLPFLAEGGTMMVFGPRGIGKTMALIALAAALATGSNFLKWKVAAPVGVLFIDGEMLLDELRARMVALLQEPAKAPLFFLTSEVVYQRMDRDLVLTHEDARESVTAILDAHPEIRVVILDNISSLFAGLDEDKKRDWEPINAWLLRLRHRGIATVLVHHAGKGGQQRGTSGREDALDTVIQLDRPRNYDAKEGARFEMRFTKARSVKGEDVEPLDLKLEDQGGQLKWSWKTLEESKEDQVVRLLKEGVTSPTDIAEELGITKGYASKILKRLKQQETNQGSHK